MFKKIIVLILIFSPLWYSLFVGYPIISEEQHAIKQKERPEISVSKRCFAVGDFRQFTDCFGISEKLHGVAFVDEVSQKINHISPIFTFLLVISLGIFIIVSIILLW